jgi:hypothetical protein
MPKFADTRAWEQAEILMQPAFIRIIANIGKKLEDFPWKHSYQEEQVWAEGTDAGVKEQFLDLQQQLQTATPEAADEIRDQLTKLPQPHPGYWLCLEKGDRKGKVDIWALCYQVCCRNYNSVLNALDSSLLVEVDTSLFNDYGEVDWQKLDDKTQQIIDQIFASIVGQETSQE